MPRHRRDGLIRAKRPGGDASVKVSLEDVTATLEAVPRRWKVIQTVREKFTCRDCEKVGQPPAPFLATPRGWAGPNLLATILFEKFGQRRPLNRQAERYAREGVDLGLSTLPDQVGTCVVALEPIHALIMAHVPEGERLRGDDTTVPLLARGGTWQARLWTYVRDNRSFAGGAAPAALFSFSADSEKTHPTRPLAGWAGVLQPHAFGGFDDLYRAGRELASVTSRLMLEPRPTEVLRAGRRRRCRAQGQGRRCDIALRLKAVERIDALSSRSSATSTISPPMPNAMPDRSCRARS